MAADQPAADHGAVAVPDWLRTLDQLVATATPAVLITVAEARGSTPREAGAKLIATASAAFGTIGGGNLEFQALRRARAMLAGRLAPVVALERFALGPSLGQCCGGDTRLLFEPVMTVGGGAGGYATGPSGPGHGLAAWLGPALATAASGQPAVLVTALDPGGAKLLVTAATAIGDLGAPAAAVEAARGVLRSGAGTRLHGRGRERLLLEPLRPPAQQVVLLGAGHVGRALVRVLAELPWSVRWVDGRPDQFPPVVPANVTIERCAAPAEVVERMPVGAAFLVMTHSHALDLLLCERILARGDARYVGLIGSATKRTRFERRLLQGGLSAAALARLVCPIGIAGIPGKHPGEIAVAVAAQLLTVFAAAEAGAPASALVGS